MSEDGSEPTAEGIDSSTRRGWLRAVGAGSVAAGLATTGCLDQAENGRREVGEQAGQDKQAGQDEQAGRSDETGSGGDSIHSGYDTREVTVETADGEPRGSVTAAIADTPELRYTGLSDTASLPADRGMLFAYESVADRVFVMREMEFGIDIVYTDADGVVTTIHHAPAPEPGEDGESHRYPGRGQYVLEVTYRWTADRDVAVGDVLRFGTREPADAT